MSDLPYDIGHRPTNLPDLARTLRAAAQGRREHANSHPRGDLGPLYNWLPSWPVDT